MIFYVIRFCQNNIYLFYFKVFGFIDFNQNMSFSAAAATAAAAAAVTTETFNSSSDKDGRGSVLAVTKMGEAVYW